jgi:filamentous hemagglutinin
LLQPEAKNFAVFDGFDFNCGLGVSCKTMDLGTASKINNPNQIYSTLKGYIDKTANFKEENKLGLIVEAKDVPNRTIELAVPTNPTSAQIEQLMRAQDYAKSKGITLKITKVKD